MQSFTHKIKMLFTIQLLIGLLLLYTQNAYANGYYISLFAGKTANAPADFGQDGATMLGLSISENYLDTPYVLEATYAISASDGETAVSPSGETLSLGENNISTNFDIRTYGLYLSRPMGQKFYIKPKIGGIRYELDYQHEALEDIKEITFSYGLALGWRFASGEIELENTYIDDEMYYITLEFREFF